MRQKGFTITELIVVITTIGILAAIVIVSYNGITNRANDSGVQSDLEAVSGQLEAYRVNPNNTGDFPADQTALETIKIKASKNSYDISISRNFIYCLGDGNQAYKLVAASKSGEVFLMTQDGFADQSLTSSDLTGTFCTTQGMTLISEGMYQPGTWRAWVGNS